MAFKKKVPSAALVFQNTANPFTFAMSDKDDENKGKCSGISVVGYSGGIIHGHWWWGELAIDLKGAKFTKDRYPILLAHNVNKPLGYSGKPTIDNAIRITDGVLLENNDDAEDFANNSAQGFPYEASVYVVPSRIEFVEKGATAKVNGYTFEGPGHIFREWEYKEVSACVFGWDPNTSTEAFAKDNFVELAIDGYKEEDMKFTDITTFSQEHPDVFAALKTHFSQTAPDNGAALAALTKERDELSAKLQAAQSSETELSKRVGETEKRLVFMQEQMLHTSFSATMSKKIAESNLPERLHGKFSKMFSVDSFVTAEGTIDMEKLNTAFAAELKEWETAVGSPSTTVMGGSSSFTKDSTGDPAPAADYNAFAASMGVKNYDQKEGA